MRRSPSHIPLAALAAILFVVAWNMSEAAALRADCCARAPRADVVILLITFALTVFADLVVAVNVGVILATLQFLRRMATSVEVRQATERGARRGVRAPRLDGAAARRAGLRDRRPVLLRRGRELRARAGQTHTDPRVLIIRLRWVPFIDITGLQALEEVIDDLHKRGVRVILCEANERVLAKFEKAGLMRLLGPDGYGADLAAALNDAEAIEFAASAGPAPRQGPTDEPAAIQPGWQGRHDARSDLS